MRMGDTLKFLWSGSLLAIITGLLCAAAAYLVTSRESDYYEATATVYATGPERTPGGVTYAAASLDADAYAFAAVSEAVLARAMVLLGNSTPQPDDLARLGSNVRLSKDETASASFVHITAVASTSTVAADTANALAEALVAWDTDRAREGLGRIAATLEAQVASLDEAVAELSDRDDQFAAQELAATVSLRVSQTNQLYLIRALQAEGTGLLALFQNATPPVSPSGPRPVMSGILGAIFGLVVGYAVVLVIQTLRIERKAPVRTASNS